jgi:hypothetical protein
LAAGFADANGLIGQLHVHAVGIRLGINRYGADIQFFAGANDAHRDLAAVGYQDFFKHGRESLWVTLPIRRTNLEERLAELDRFGVFHATWVMTPLASALISFITFIASMMQTTVSG